MATHRLMGGARAPVGVGLLGGVAEAALRLPRSVGLSGVEASLRSDVGSAEPAVGPMMQPEGRQGHSLVRVVFRSLLVGVGAAPGLVLATPEVLL